jgi:hypothetical protein
MTMLQSATSREMSGLPFEAEPGADRPGKDRPEGPAAGYSSGPAALPSMGAPDAGLAPLGDAPEIPVLQEKVRATLPGVARPLVAGRPVHEYRQP